jgi:heptose-I-phosphate ethanolaminephosphotransferase
MERGFSRQNLSRIGWFYLFFWFFSGVIQTWLLPIAGLPGFRNILFFSAMWLVPVLLFPRWSRSISAVIGVVLWAASLVSLGYLGIYGQEFSQSVIFIIFESNQAEAGEYLSQYFDFWLIVGLIVYTLAAIGIWRRLRPVYLPRTHAIGLALLLLIGNLGYPYLRYVPEGTEYATLKLQKRMESAVPWQLVIGYLQYRQQLANVQSLLQANVALPPLVNLKDGNGDAPRTLVLVIGESTTSRRMSLYGYPRPTTPRLEVLKEKGELTVFSDVITSRPYTIEILQQALTFANQEEPDRFPAEPTLMNLMRQAGYRSFWITNQQTMTHRNTLLTTFSQQADEAYYLNQQRRQNARQYDQEVFDPFLKVLQHDAPKKFIVVHLLGTHSGYGYRYPEEYEKFTGREKTPPGLSDRQIDLYNDYDNAVLYNDFVVSRLIEMFSENHANGFLLYFSDHGEEVFDTPPHHTLGRNEGVPTRNMYQVPFILWQSPEWRANHPQHPGDMQDRKYSNAHFIHTWSDLAGLSYNRFKPELSLVNPGFKVRPRWIGDPSDRKNLRNFDVLFP